MKIEIDDDCVDMIVKAAIVSDYASLTEDLEKYEKDQTHLHEDDAIAYEEVVKALLTLSGWYFLKGEFEEALEAFRK